MAAVLIGGGTLVLSGGSSLVSGSVPTTSVASNSTPKPHPVFMFKGPERAVYSESVVPVKSGGYETIIMVKGSLSAISSTSVSVKRPDTGAIVTASVASSTKFIRTTEAALASDLSSGKVVTVMLVEVGGTAKSVMAPPKLGVRVRGPLTAISSNSISVKRPKTGAIVTASVASSTKFIRTTEAALASDLSSGKVVTVMLVEVRGTARLVAVPPSPGSRPVSHGTPLAGHVAPPASSNTNSSGTAGTTA